MVNPDGKATEGSPACGDMVSVYIKVDSETKIITDIKFESYGCASNIATASIERLDSPDPVNTSGNETQAEQQEEKEQPAQKAEPESDNFQMPELG